MGDPKRIQFTTVSKSLTDDKDCDTSEKQPLKTAKHESRKSIRIDIQLETRNTKEENYEFSYPDLVKAAIKNSKINGAGPVENENQPGILKPMRDPDDPLAKGQDEEEAKNLASYFERKYGGANVAKANKKGKKRKFDFKDYGLGYDETDPFVDNSEACDELLPNNLTTKWGGFYVNTGQLELRQVSEDEEGEDSSSSSSEEGEGSESSSSSASSEDDEDGKVKKIRRRPVIRDDDEEGSSKDLAKKQSGKTHRPSTSTSMAAALLKKNKLRQQQLSKRKKFLMAAGIEGSPIKDSKKDFTKKNLTVAEMLQRKAKQQQQQQKAEDKSENSQAISDSSALMDNIIDSVIQESFKGDKGSEEDKAKTSGETSGDSGPTSPTAEIELPADISDQLRSACETLKNIAAANKGCESKQKFFTPRVNELLLEIETECQSKLFKGTRSSIYKFLAAHLPCNKQTLTKRAVNLKQAANSGDLPSMIQTLKDGIDAVMPDNISKYEK